MTIKKFYRGVKLPSKHGFNLELGNITKELSNVYCTCGKTYVTSLDTKNILNNISEDLLQFKRKLSGALKSTSFSKDCIFTYDFPKNVETGVNNKILNFEFYLKNIKPLKQEQVINEITLILDPLLEDLNSRFKTHNITISETKN